MNINLKSAKNEKKTSQKSDIKPISLSYLDTVCIKRVDWRPARQNNVTTNPIKAFEWLFLIRFWS